MKASELIKKWRSEGVSDSLIRKRLIVLSQQAKNLTENTALDETHDSLLEAQITQTQLDVPQLNLAKNALDNPLSPLVYRLLIACIIVNILSIIIFFWLQQGHSTKIKDLEGTIDTLKIQIEKNLHRDK